MTHLGTQKTLTEQKYADQIQIGDEVIIDAYRTLTVSQTDWADKSKGAVILRGIGSDGKRMRARVGRCIRMDLVS